MSQLLLSKGPVEPGPFCTPFFRNQVDSVTTSVFYLLPLPLNDGLTPHALRQSPPDTSTLGNVLYFRMTRVFRDPFAIVFKRSGSPFETFPFIRSFQGAFFCFPSEFKFSPLVYCALFGENSGAYCPPNFSSWELDEAGKQ